MQSGRETSLRENDVTPAIKQVITLKKVTTTITTNNERRKQEKTKQSTNTIKILKQQEGIEEYLKSNSN